MAIDVARAADKWARRGAQSQTDFIAGVNASKDWNANTLAAKDRWASGVQEAAGNDMFGKGVSKVPTGTWRTKTAQKAGNWSGAAAAAKGDFQSGLSKTAPVIDGALSGYNRGPKGTNYGIIQKVGDALMAAKKAGQTR